MLSILHIEKSKAYSDSTFALFLQEIHDIYKNAELTKEPWYYNGFTAMDYTDLSSKSIYNFYRGILSFRMDKIGSMRITANTFEDLKDVMKDVPTLKLMHLFYQKMVGFFLFWLCQPRRFYLPRSIFPRSRPAN